jgi:hypothetical protein
MVNQQKSH